MLFPAARYPVGWLTRGRAAAANSPFRAEIPVLTAEGLIRLEVECLEGPEEKEPLEKEERDEEKEEREDEWEE